MTRPQREKRAMGKQNSKRQISKEKKEELIRLAKKAVATYGNPDWPDEFSNRSISVYDGFYGMTIELLEPERVVVYATRRDESAEKRVDERNQQSLNNSRELKQVGFTGKLRAGCSGPIYKQIRWQVAFADQAIDLLRRALILEEFAGV